MSTMLSIYPKEDSSVLLSIDDEKKAVYVNGQPCEFTQQEFYLLLELAQNVNRPLSREELLLRAWANLIKSSFNLSSCIIFPFFCLKLNYYSPALFTLIGKIIYK